LLGVVMDYLKPNTDELLDRMETLRRGVTGPGLAPAVARAMNILVKKNSLASTPGMEPRRKKWNPAPFLDG